MLALRFEQFLKYDDDITTVHFYFTKRFVESKT